MKNTSCERCQGPLEGTYFRFCENCLMEKVPSRAPFQNSNYRVYKEVLMDKCHIIRKKIGDS